jgi:protein-tyrosine phosphatase
VRAVIPDLLWIGNAKDGRNITAVLKLGIEAVIDLAIEEPPMLFPRETVYCRFPLFDGEGNPPARLRAAIDTTVRFIRGNVRTLVTCDGGMSRSPAIVAAALVAIERLSPEAALERVASAGPHDVSTTFWADVKKAGLESA